MAHQSTTVHNPDGSTVTRNRDGKIIDHELGTAMALEPTYVDYVKPKQDADFSVSSIPTRAGQKLRAIRKRVHVIFVRTCAKGLTKLVSYSQAATTTSPRENSRRRTCCKLSPFLSPKKTRWTIIVYAESTLTRFATELPKFEIRSDLLAHSETIVFAEARERAKEEILTVVEGSKESWGPSSAVLRTAARRAGLGSELDKGLQGTVEVYPICGSPGRPLEPPLVIRSAIDHDTNIDIVDVFHSRDWPERVFQRVEGRVSHTSEGPRLDWRDITIAQEGYYDIQVIQRVTNDKEYVVATLPIHIIEGSWGSGKSPEEDEQDKQTLN